MSVERKYYAPPTDAGSGAGGDNDLHQFTPEDLKPIYERMDEIRTKIPGGTEQPEFYYLNAKRRIIGAGIPHRDHITTELIHSQLVRGMGEAKDFHHEEAYCAVDALRWGFLAYAVPHDPQLLQSWTVLYPTLRDYNQMQREQTVEEVTLDPEQSQTLAWMLDQVAIPHDVTEAETHISLAPLEHQLQIASRVETRKEPFHHSWADHEKQLNVSELMEQWKQQDQQEG